MRVTWRKPELDYLLNSPTGPVGRHLSKVAYLVKTAAQAQVGVKTGALKKSIKVGRHERKYNGQKITVGSNLNYALFHHQGTKKHVIYPKSGGVLRFSVSDSRGGSRVIYAKKVNHPGTKPNRYLTDNLYLTGAKKIVIRRT